MRTVNTMRGVRVLPCKLSMSPGQEVAGLAGGDPVLVAGVMSSCMEGLGMTDSVLQGLGGSDHTDSIQD